MQTRKIYARVFFALSAGATLVSALGVPRAQAEPVDNGGACVQEERFICSAHTEPDGSTWYKYWHG
jgi:hypothetical protein